MTKKSILEREKKRIKLVSKYFNKRKELNKMLKSNKYSVNNKWLIMKKLQSLPKDSSYIRLRNRCYETGRSRGYIRRFGLSRIKFRELVVTGNMPGIKKSSW